jgi:hypothetical protein
LSKIAPWSSQTRAIWVPFDEFSQSKKPCFLVVFEVNKDQFEIFLKIKKIGFFQKLKVIKKFK